MKKLIVVLFSVMFITTLLVAQLADDLFISEYLEGGSNNKALEIFNGTGAPVDLGDYQIVRANNGNVWADGDRFEYPAGTMIADGDVWVNANSGSIPEILALADSIGGTLGYFNGNDSIGLFKITATDTVLIDVMGENGVDEYWAVAGVDPGMQNHTLVRKSSVTAGNTDWTSSAGSNAANSEWIVNPQDDYSNLGSHTFGGNELPLISSIVRVPAGDILVSTTVSVSATVTDADGTISLVELHWGTSSGSLTNTINMTSIIGNVFTTVSVIPAQAVGTTVYYEVYAEDDIPEGSTSSEYDYTVIEAQSTTIPYLEPFDADLGICYTYSDSGATKEWYWNSGGYAYMSGYNSGETEEDWLVLPAIDFDSYANETMTFDTWYNYGTDNTTNYLKLYYSPDYPGLGDPSSYTWTELSYTQPGASSTWSPSGSIDLSTVSGSAVSIAFKYRYEVTMYRNWGVDNIDIHEVLTDTDSYCDYTGVTQPSLVGFTSMNNNEPAAFDVYKFNVVDTGSGDTVPTHVTQITIDAGPANTADWTDTIAGAKVSTSGILRAEFNATTITDDAIVFENIPLGTFDIANAGDDIFTLSIWLTDTGNLIETEIISLGIDGAAHGFDADDSGSQFDGTFAIDSFFDIFYEIEGIGLETEGFLLNVNPGAPFGGKVKVVDGAGNTDTDATGTVTLSSTNAPITSVTGLVQTLAGGEYTWSDLIYPTSGDDFEVRADYSLYGWFVETATIHCTEVAEILINEVDADQTGTDADEFIELFDGGVGNYPLDGYCVVLYNGSDDLSYNAAFDLDGYSTNPNGYFVIGSATVPNVDLVGWVTNGVQNGADAVALYTDDAVNFPNDTSITLVNLVDAIVYDTSDSDDPALLVLLNAAEPQVDEDGNGNKDTESNQRIPNGSGGLRNTSTYAQTLPTPGAMNQAGTLDTPVNVIITSVPNGPDVDVTISWDAVTGAASYTVYRTDDPNATFPDDWTAETGIVGTSWNYTTDKSKRFYVVTATN